MEKSFSTNQNAQLISCLYSHLAALSVDIFFEKLCALRQAIGHDPGRDEMDVEMRKENGNVRFVSKK